MPICQVFLDRRLGSAILRARSLTNDPEAGWATSSPARCRVCLWWRWPHSHRSVGLIPRLRVPQVVVLIVGGMIVGPQVFDWAEPEDIELLSNVGLGFLFLLAGYELELALFRQRAGKLAVIAWVASAALAVGLVGILA